MRGYTGVAAAILLVTAPAMAQPPGGMEIYLASFDESERGITVGTPSNVTRRPGYDNQPSFSLDGSYLLYASIDSSAQSDVMRYDIEQGTVTRVTDTAESEYSPIVLPDGTGFSVVRVEMDGTQRLWRFDLDGTNPSLVLADVDSVGYYVWVDAHQVALFILGPPHSLRLVNTNDGDEQVIALDIGRALQLVPGGSEVSFVRRVASENWRIDALDPVTGRTRSLGRALDGSEDCAWTPNGMLLMALRRTLFSREPGEEGTWRKVKMFSGPELELITRIAVSPDGSRLALVAAE